MTQQIYIYSTPAPQAAVHAYGAASNFTLNFSGGGMAGPRKANISFNFPSNSTIQAKELYEFDQIGNAALIVNSAGWQNSITTPGNPNQHTCDANATDRNGYTYKAKVVLLVPTSDDTYSNTYP